MSIDRWMDKDMVYLYSEILFTHKKNEILPFAATQMDLEIIILSKSNRKTQMWFHVYVESKKMMQMNLFTKHRLTDRKQTYGYLRGKWERDKLGVLD